MIQCSKCDDTSGTGFALKTGFHCLECYKKIRKRQKRLRRLRKKRRD